jgi:uncharacterized SAM-binding protein YcdF (DUF218 family)
MSIVYSPLTTATLTAWLSSQLPKPPPPAPGRTPAAPGPRPGDLCLRCDGPGTAQRLLQLGVPPERIAGDNCARTTWENASLTSPWIRAHHSDANRPAILLITDPWQLPRASRAFQRQPLPVTPIPADPDLPPHQSNRLALRESAATVL